MVNDAEKFRGEDEKQRERVATKTGLESYCFSMKQTVEDGKLKDKISDTDCQTVLNKCNDTIEWLVLTNSLRKSGSFCNFISMLSSSSSHFTGSSPVFGSGAFSCLSDLQTCSKTTVFL